ncbi:hypothetical protein BU23DRAFT_593385 [Bimuria novae-zelandiae CBS 107.79]|uniref:Uncharacterized protein n=1 Tax=Bimuria novae-zelandiae CBS 107.79 TaxID=1447943 RepID=A0A6A5UMG6_9PLEO|nr:hypothetical protein BU23DRAFT_593385 [Bimuria novae-zelandiae CBS 107.79]
MELYLYIPPCVQTPPHHLHPPPANKPLRIRIQGPLETIQKLLPHVSWHPIVPFPQPGGLQLANITHQVLYGQVGGTVADGSITVRDEYLAWCMEGRRPTSYIDYYGVTFDHLVEPDNLDPEVLVINIIEVDKGGTYGDGGSYANEVLLFRVDPTDFTGKKVLAVPRCCQHKKGTQDRKLINTMVMERSDQLSRHGTKSGHYLSSG